VEAALQQNGLLLGSGTIRGSLDLSSSPAPGTSRNHNDNHNRKKYEPTNFLRTAPIEDARHGQFGLIDGAIKDK
jgi:hypothetical protein